MASLTDIRTGIAANLATFRPGVNVSAYILANPIPPCLWVRPNPDELATYHRAMGDGLEHWHLIVEAYVTVNEAAQQLLDGFVESSGPTSVKAAVESDLTLGGAAQSLQVENAHGYAEYARPDGTTYLGCRWNVLVYPVGGT